MKNAILTFTLLFIAVLSYGQMTSNNTGGTPLDEFDKVKVEDGINLVLEFGNSESVRVEGQGLTDADIEASVFLDKLTISRVGSKNVDATVYVTYKNLKKVIAEQGSTVRSNNMIDMDDEFEIEARDASNVNLEIVADEIEVDVEGNSRVELKAEASEVEANVSSSSTLMLTGSAQELEVDADGSAEFLGYDFNSQEAELAANNGANIRVNVTEQMDAEADNGGKITYRGNPTETKSEPKNGGVVEPAR